jgi:glycogen(starch) synthase
VRILFLSSEYPPETGWGGIGTCMATIAPALVRRGHEVHVLSCAEQSRGDYIESGVHVHRRPLIPFPGVVRLTKMPFLVKWCRVGLSAFVESRRLGPFDIIEYPNWNAEGWVYSLLRMRPTVCTIYTTFTQMYIGQNPSRDLRATARLERLTAEGADVVVTSSPLMASKIGQLGWLDRRQIDVIARPVDWQRWSNSSNVSDTLQNVLFLGRVERRKAPEVLVEAVQLLRKELPNVKALFAGSFNSEGDGKPLTPWVNRALCLDGCEFLGHVADSEIQALIDRCRVVALSSRFESFGLTAVEGMAAGRPAVVTDSCGVHEIVSKSGGGTVARADDPRALAEALRPFLVNPEHARAVGERGREAVRRRLDPAMIASETEQIYEQAIERFKGRIKSKAKGFPYAIPARVGSIEIPERWRKWASDEAAREPWRHFYLNNTHHVLELLTRHPLCKTRNDLSGLRILDVGCTGAVSVLLAELGATVVALDVDVRWLREAAVYTGIVGQNSSKNLQFILGDGFALPFVNEAFDIVWSNGLLEHFDNPQQMLAEMRRVLRPTGAMLAIVPNKWTLHTLFIREQMRRNGGYSWDSIGRERSYSRRSFRRLLRESGFDVVAESAKMLRRSVLDDNLVLPRLSRWRYRSALLKLINSLDWLEARGLWFPAFGFVVGAVTSVSSTTRSSPQSWAVGRHATHSRSIISTEAG